MSNAGDAATCLRIAAGCFAMARLVPSEANVARSLIW
jgi:hypothetical protein